MTVATAHPSQEEIVEELVALWRLEYPDQNVDFARYYRWRVERLAIKDVRHHKPADPKKAERYAKMLQDGVEFRPVVVLNLGKPRVDLVDGFHRTYAHKLNGEETIVAFVGSPR